MKDKNKFPSGVYMTGTFYFPHLKTKKKKEPLKISLLGKYVSVKEIYFLKYEYKSQLPTVMMR